jgi:hypothetical protein
MRTRRMTTAAATAATTTTKYDLGQLRATFMEHIENESQCATSKEGTVAATNRERSYHSNVCLNNYTIRNIH